jgi:GGDEF domain-containing protein
MKGSRPDSERGLRLGFLPSLAGLSLLLVLGVLGLTQAAVLIIGQGPRPLALLVAGAMALVLSPFLAAWLLRLMFQLDAARQRHSVNATKDDLTGAHNRRHFMQVAEREWSRCRRYAEDGAMLLIDADQFKSLKSSHGGACCDALLRDLTRLVTQSLRQPDLLARFGPESLIVYLPNTEPARVAGHLQVAQADAPPVGVQQFAQAFPVHRAGAAAAVEFLRVQQRLHLASGRRACPPATTG